MESAFSVYKSMTDKFPNHNTKKLVTASSCTTVSNIYKKLNMKDALKSSHTSSSTDGKMPKKMTKLEKQKKLLLEKRKRELLQNVGDNSIFLFDGSPKHKKIKLDEIENESTHLNTMLPPKVGKTVKNITSPGPSSKIEKKRQMDKMQVKTASAEVNNTKAAKTAKKSKKSINTEPGVEKLISNVSNGEMLTKQCKKPAKEKNHKKRPFPAIVIKEKQINVKKSEPKKKAPKQRKTEQATTSQETSNKASTPKKNTPNKQTPKKAESATKANSGQKEVSSSIRKDLFDNQVVKQEPFSPRTLTTVLEFPNSIEDGLNTFSWLMNDLDIEKFMKDNWEKCPVHVSRKDHRSYYKNLMSTPMIDKMLRDCHIEYTKNLDVTSYSNGIRETHNLQGRANPSVVWDFYANGCSVRLLNPQTYLDKINILCATMQEFFGCMVGANAYLTPPNSQGFAPHYDDIEAFILQIEGKKHWKLYAPRNSSEILPRVSSGNFSQDELGQPILDVTLNPGDFMYFPRGTIHQATTVPDCHSLHITVSVYQKHSYADLLETLMPGMLAIAFAEDQIFRQGLPLDLPRHLGLVHSDQKSHRRDQIVNHLKSLIDRLVQYAPIDTAVDQFYKNYQHSALPPVLLPEEKACTSFGDGLEMGANGKLRRRKQVMLDTSIRLLRANILRIVMEDEHIRAYHHVDNNKEYHAVDPQFLELTENQAQAVESLIKCYPDFMIVSALPIDNEEEKLLFVQDLWEKGLVMTSKPLDAVDII